MKCVKHAEVPEGLIFESEDTMRTAQLFVLFFVLAVVASADIIEFVVEFDSRGETHTLYISGENLGFNLTSCTTLCGFNFTTPQASQKVVALLLGAVEHVVFVP